MFLMLAQSSFINLSLAQATSIDGVYTLSSEGSSVIDTAIASAIEEMSFIKRPIARGRLKKTNPAYERIAISQSESTIEVQFDDRKPIRMPADGSAMKWQREDGETFDVSAVWRGSDLVQTFKAEDGQRVNTFRIGSKQDRLTLIVEITSEQLPKPVTYALAYQRTG